MATKSENAEIAVLQDQNETMKGDMSEIKADIKAILIAINAFPVQYVPISIFNNAVEKSDKVHHELDKKIESTKKNNRFWNLAWTIIGALIYGVVVYLITGKQRI